jgi:hypothetical protein
VHQQRKQRLTARSSGIFGYINYLVEKDRKYILNTLINGALHPFLRFRKLWLLSRAQ